MIGHLKDAKRAVYTNGRTDAGRTVGRVAAARYYVKHRDARLAYAATPERRETRRQYAATPEHREAHRAYAAQRRYEITPQCELFAGVVLAAFEVLSDEGKRSLASRLVNMEHSQDRVAHRVSRRQDVDMTLADYYDEGEAVAAMQFTHQQQKKAS